MEFGILVEKMVSSEILKQEIYKLLERKQSGQELDFEPRIPEISDFIESEIERIKKQTNQQPALPSHDDNLDEFFRSALTEIWK
jgi:predicted nucleotidyltransferase